MICAPILVRLPVLTLFAMTFALSAHAQQTIAYWAQNDNALPGGGFGFTPADFPQHADAGDGTLMLENFIDAVNDQGAYTRIQSIAGTTVNALPGFAAGGSLSPQGGLNNGNNGMSIVLTVRTSGLQDIEVSWAQQGTATGFSSRQFAWSIDGVNFTDFGDDTGALGTSWTLRTYALGTVTELNDQPIVYFRITLTGASRENGNNRFDNLLIRGQTIGDPNPPVEFVCGNEVTRIHAIQGSGFASPLQGQPVQIEAVVAGQFQTVATDGLDGFYLQEADVDHDDDPRTSEGIFVFGAPAAVARGDRVRVAGTVTEFSGETQIKPVSDLLVCASDRLDQISPARLELPVSDPIEFEAIEGMWVTTDQSWIVTDVFNAARFGEVQVSNGRLYQPTQIVEPGAPAQALQAANDRNRILIDDARNGSNRRPFIDGGDNQTELAASNPIRNGYRVDAGFEGFMAFGFGRYRIHPLHRPVFVPEANARSHAPVSESADTLRVAAFNVENLFTTLNIPGNECGPNLLGCRGATTASELARQLAKLVAAIDAMNVDLVALTEVENDGDDSTLLRLADALNAVEPAGDWRFVATGFVGTDAIKPAFLYRAGRVLPEGPFSILDSSVDLRFDTSRQRPALAQTFRAFNSGRFNAVAVHLRSKGSCPPGSPAEDVNADQGDGQACWNLWRTVSAEALVDWLSIDPTGQGEADTLILGDFNAYGRENPLMVLKDAGYVDLATTRNGGDPALYSFTFFGQAGALDHGFANPSMAEQVLGARYWPINADEIPVFNYAEGLLPGGLVDKPESFFNADPFRSSDHDPLIIELDLVPCAPGIINRPSHPGGKILPSPQC